jgi:hypothetical protein
MPSMSTFAVLKANKPPTLGLIPCSLLRPPPNSYQPEPINRIDTSLNDLHLEKMDPQVRERVRDRLRARAHDIMAELKIGGQGWLGGGIREAIDLAFIKSQLDKLLGL